jgi:hypothetical protein
MNLRPVPLSYRFYACAILLWFRGSWETANCELRTANGEPANSFCDQPPACASATNTRLPNCGSQNAIEKRTFTTWPVNPRPNARGTTRSAGLA